MPEGPECYKLAKRMEAILKGSRIIRFEICGGRYQKHGPPKGLEEFNQYAALNNIKVERMGVKGKLIYIITNSDNVILITLGLSGTWVKNKTAYCGVELQYRNTCSLSSYDVLRKLYFRDKLHYGTLSFVTKAELEKKLKQLGPDVLDKEQFTWERFKQICTKQSKHSLPVVLMNQNCIAGIGNYLKAEILYAARASVSSPIADYTEEQLYRVYQVCSVIPYKCTFGNYRLNVYGRKYDPYGNKVFRVQTKDKRTTHWVPNIMPIDIRLGVEGNLQLMTHTEQSQNDNITRTASNNTNTENIVTSDTLYPIELSSDSD